MDRKATIFFLDAGKLQTSAVPSTQQTESMSWAIFKDKKPINNRKCEVAGR